MTCPLFIAINCPFSSKFCPKLSFTACMIAVTNCSTCWAMWACCVHSTTGMRSTTSNGPLSSKRGYIFCQSSTCVWVGTICNTRWFTRTGCYYTLTGLLSIAIYFPFSLKWHPWSCPCVFAGILLTTICKTWWSFWALSSKSFTRPTFVAIYATRWRTTSCCAAAGSNIGTVNSFRNGSIDFYIAS